MGKPQAVKTKSSLLWLGHFRPAAHQNISFRHLDSANSFNGGQNVSTGDPGDTGAAPALGGRKATTRRITATARRRIVPTKEEQQLRGEERRLRKQAEEQLRLQTQNTTVPEFLDACHSHLFLGLDIRRDKDSSTKGNPANAGRKLCPAKIREWTNFPDEQILIWDDLMNTDFVAERHFCGDDGLIIKTRRVEFTMRLCWDTVARIIPQGKLAELELQAHVKLKPKRNFGMTPTSSDHERTFLCIILNVNLDAAVREQPQHLL
ncbi:hypothetical protein CIHG_02817 [Coccidioides immitis H538.4]|uniref:Uncharacterized protein n=1 Tax=Coccidioides immitis H538.4 TaxID=396776 RepID=A0A0J8RM46_COCIT|nr:hypothetical protein CIHG_02817 [Coccidioides immitis H538.4]